MISSVLVSGFVGNSFVSVISGTEPLENMSESDFFGLLSSTTLVFATIIFGMFLTVDFVNDISGLLSSTIFANDDRCLFLSVVFSCGVSLVAF